MGYLPAGQLGALDLGQERAVTTGTREGWPGLGVGWLLARPRWGQGFATEAGRAAIDYAFGVLGAEKVISLIRPENHLSVRVAERLGESYERTIELHDRRVDIYCVRRRNTLG